MDCTVCSMLTTTPLRSPVEGLVPMPTTSTPSGESSPTTTQILVVPISSPTISSDLAINRSLKFASRVV